MIDCPYSNILISRDDKVMLLTVLLPSDLQVFRSSFEESLEILLNDVLITFDQTEIFQRSYSKFQR